MKFLLQCLHVKDMTYYEENGKSKFMKWLHSLDNAIQEKIIVGFERLESDRSCDVKPTKECQGMYELRVKINPEFRFVI